MNDIPCYDRKTHTDCPKRSVGCHGTCKEWREYEIAENAKRAARDKERKEKQALWEHFSAVRNHNEKVRTKHQKEMRLIDADALREELDSVLNWDTNNEYNMYSDTMDAIDNAPTIEAEPVRHGRWIQVDETKCKCTNCDSIVLIAIYPHGDKNYCPNCGAKMDKEETT